MKLPQFYYKRNRLQQLRGFYFTVQHGSVSKAAEFLGLNQSTVTLQIQSLERDVKSTLFKREGRKISLTEDGKTLYNLIIPYIQGMEQVYEHFQSIRQKRKTKTVRIAAHHVAISYLLPKYIAEFQSNFPEIELWIENIPRHDALDKLNDGTFDFIFFPNTPTPEECISHTTHHFDPLLIMHKEHPLAKSTTISLEEISKYNLLRVDGAFTTLPIFEETVKTYNWRSNIHFNNSDWNMLKSFVNQNLGVALVSTLCINSERDKNIIGKNMRHVFPEQKYELTILRGAHFSDPAQKLISILGGDILLDKNKNFN